MSFVRPDPTMPAEVAHAFPQGSASTKSEPRSGSADRFVASLLVAKHAVTAAQLDEVFKRRRRTGQRVVDALVADGSITPEAALDAVASHMGISATRINVVWVGLEGAGALAGIAAKLNREMGALGFRPENRGWEPHVTVARVKGPRNLDRVRAAVQGFAKEEFGESVVDRIRLKRSVLKPEGPEYTTVVEVPLPG